MTDLQTILDAGKVIPVLTYNSIDEALETSRTLYGMGIRVFEITLRHPTALEALHTPLAPSVPAHGRGIRCELEMSQDAADVASLSEGGNDLQGTLPGTIHAHAL